jgi:hypothetical protein
MTLKEVVGVCTRLWQYLCTVNVIQFTRTLQRKYVLEFLAVKKRDETAFTGPLEGVFYVDLQDNFSCKREKSKILSIRVVVQYNLVLDFKI